MTRSIYALLVGINDYRRGVGALRGCVNDVKRMRKFLELRTKDGEFGLHHLLLTSGDPDDPNEAKPTRQAVIDGFRTHLCQAGNDDVALFYFSGHGSQEKAPPELCHLEPDRLDETLVCYDSRTEGKWDLADKELAVLVAEVAKRNPHIIVVVDSCHSGTVTRAVESGVRLAPTDKRDRPLSSFEGFEAIQAQKVVGPGERSESDWIVMPEGKHVVISACRAEEVSVERFLGEETRGVFSYYLLDTLQRTGVTPTYRDVFARVTAMVRNQVSTQTPYIEASDVKQLQEPFLGGAVRPQPPYFSLTYRKPKGWVIGGGAVHGIQAPTDGETTTLAVFASETDLAAANTIKDALGFARVTAVEPGESQVEFTLKDETRPIPQQTFKAQIVSQPLPPILVTMQGDEAGLDLVREALKIAGPSRTPSLIVREATGEDTAATAERPGQEGETVGLLTLMARDERYLIRRTDDAYPLMVPVEQGYTKVAAWMAVQRLEHVARWLQIAQLENKTSALPPDAVAMELYAVEADGSMGERIDTTGTVRLEHSWQNEKWVSPRIMLRLSNNTDRRLYCMLLVMSETFGVDTAGLLKGGGEWLEPKGQTGSETWATYRSSRSIPFKIPKALREQGVVAIRDILKLIVSTAESNATLLEREELGVATRGTRGLGPTPPKSTLNRLMDRIQTRAVGDEAGEEEAIADWITSQATLVTVRPRDSVPVPETGEPAAPLSDTVTLEGHAALRANARLTSLAEGSRDVGNLALPSVLRQHPELSRPFEFSDYRGGEPGLSVLEMEVEGDTYKAVTPEAPLTLHVAKPIAEDEYVLPLAFDPETKLFLPLGSCRAKDDGVTITIDRLPQPTAETKGKLGSVKLFFQKFVADKLGLDGATSRLAVATLGDDGEPQYEESPIVVAQKIEAAQRILLYVHGFLGDTKGLVRSPLGDRYDLVLAFDYENINTPIGVTALKLKDHLKAVGLGAGHDKTLHIVAHSMGTMVTRWLIEREEGHKFVQKVVLAAPPNAGTPWAKIQDLALVGLGMAINGLAAIAWPPSIIPTLIGTLSTIVGGVEKVDVTCDQLKPGSDFYKQLNASEAPGSYAIIAGNTSKIGPAGPLIRSSEVPLLKRLAEKLTSKQTRYAIMSLAFFGKPNDYAVSVESMLALPSGRLLQPAQEIACDHSSYFVTKVGLEALAKALG